MERIKQHWMASRFINRLIAGGGSLTQDEINALHNWCYWNDVNGLLSSYIAYYPFVGGTGTTQSINNFKLNLIAPSPTGTILYDLTANNITASMCTSKGYQGNGTNSYWDTGLNHNSVINLINCGLSFYSRTNSIIASNQADMGVASGATAQFSLITGLKLSNSKDFFNAHVNNTASQLGVNTTVTWGYKSGNRISNSLALYHNGIQIGTSTGTTDAGINSNILLGTLSNNYSGRQYAMFGISLGFTQAQEAIRYKIEQNTQTILNRQINF